MKQIKPLTVEKRKGKPDKEKSSSEKLSGGKAQNALEKSMLGKSAGNKIIELGIFVDEAALGLFMPYLGAKEYVKLRELVLAFVNGVGSKSKSTINNCVNEISVV